MPRGGFYSTFEPALRQLMNLHAGWRAPVPPTYHGYELGFEAPGPVRLCYRRRIDELIDVLESLRGDPGLLDEAWNRLKSGIGSLRLPSETE
jgi:hypothetical protein